MYIWFAVDINNSLKHLRKQAIKISDSICFKENNYSLPFHISLKISCEINENDLSNIVSDVSKYYETLKPFKVNVDKIELNGSICWLKIKENKNLIKIHNYLDDLLFNKYGYKLHPFDLNFIYHTTLFLDSDLEKIKEAYSLIKDEKLLKTITCSKFIIGGSINGEIGTYSVYKTIDKNENRKINK